MVPNESEGIDRLKSHLRFYEDLVRDQAAQIASLKAEVAYLKTRTRRQKTTQDGLSKIEVAQVYGFYTKDSLHPSNTVLPSHYKQRIHQHRRSKRLRGSESPITPL